VPAAGKIVSTWVAPVLPAAEALIVGDPDCVSRK
jgi:hypothetical protein